MTEANKTSSAETVTITDDQYRMIREAFNQYDKEGQGFISTGKLSLVMRNLGHNLRRDQLRDLVRLVDTDNSGTIEFEEFLPLMAAKLKEKEEMAFYKNLFRMLDKKSRGHISCDDLRYILQGLAQEVDLTLEEIDAMILDIDADGNGEVSFDEFYQLMTSE